MTDVDEGRGVNGSDRRKYWNGWKCSKKGRIGTRNSVDKITIKSLIGAITFATGLRNPGNHLETTRAFTTRKEMHLC